MPILCKAEPVHALDVDMQFPYLILTFLHVHHADDKKMAGVILPPLFPASTSKSIAAFMSNFNTQFYIVIL